MESMPKRAFSISRVTRSSSMREAELLENRTASSASMIRPITEIAVTKNVRLARVMRAGSGPDNR